MVGLTMENDSEKSQGKKHQFSADRPIGCIEEDLLGRAPFAESLASAIKDWRGNESLVVALCGPWGSGKSSVKNMVLQRLCLAKVHCPLIIEFNPWQWSGQNQLAQAFFQEIGLVLGRSDRSEDGKRRAAKWRTYGTYLTLGASLAKSLKAILPILGLPGSGIADMLAKGMEQSEAVAQEGSKGVEDQAIVQQQTLIEIKKELSDSLKELERPILVVLDDIDRLTPEEIRLLFQLVKVNADFPNVVYLLLFQRDIVERSLDSPPAINGQEFLEKIVQVGFDIPRIERPRLEKILFAGLDELLTEADAGKRFDQKRWGNLFLGGLRPYFQTLRDVYRYLASLSFHVSLFRSTGSFEVSPVDLIALEVLRVFETVVYQRLPDAKPELTNQRDRAHDSHDQNKRTRKLVESIVEAASHPSQVREIVKELFPPVEWVFNGPMYSHDFEEGRFRELRLCHSDVFDRYFHLGIPEGDISQAELDRVLSLVGDREGLVAEFRALNKRSLLAVALDRLEAYKQKVDLQHAVSFITALFDIGDELPEDRGGFFSISPDTHASRIIYWYLKQEMDIGRRGDVLKESMKATTGLYLPIRTASLEGNEEKRKKNPDAFNVADADLDELHQICVKKIEQAAGSGTLASHPKMLSILYCWCEWGSPSKPREWVEKLIQSPEGVRSFLTACLHRSTSQGMGDYMSLEHWRINLKSVEDFVPVDTLEKKLAVLLCKNFNDKHEKAIKAFQKAIKRRREGKSDDGWRDDEDE
jgi:predicted KAP-like P-loop ATPase